MINKNQWRRFIFSHTENSLGCIGNWFAECTRASLTGSPLDEKIGNIWGWESVDKRHCSPLITFPPVRRNEMRRYFHPQLSFGYNNSLSPGIVDSIKSDNQSRHIYRQEINSSTIVNERIIHQDKRIIKDISQQDFIVSTLSHQETKQHRLHESRNLIVPLTKLSQYRSYS